VVHNFLSMKTTRTTTATKRFLPLLALAGALVSTAQAADITKANNTNNLNLGTSWGGGTAPGSTDVALWDSTVAGANTAALGANLSWQGIRIANPGGAVTITAANTLTLSSAGIDMSAATQNLTVNSSLILGAAQTWNVATGRALGVGGAVNNGGNLLTVDGVGNTNISGVISGVGGLTKNGAGQTTLFGASTYTGTTTINAGTLLLGGGGATGSISGSSVITGAAAGTLQINRSDDVTISNTITGALGLAKFGAGAATINGTTTYTGQTRARAGTLLINGDISTSATLINQGTLGGSGTVGGVTVDGTNGGGLAPGGSVGATGILTTGNLNLTSTTGTLTLTIQLNGLTVGTGYDQVNTVGTVNLGTNEVLSLTLGFTPTFGNSFTIVNNDGGDAITGSFSGLSEGTIFNVGGTDFQISYIGGTGNDAVLNVVPEPNTVALLGLVGIAFLTFRRRPAGGL